MGKIVTLGEIMLRLSTADGTRLAQTDSFQAHYGGGEANVAISLANFGHEAIFVSKVPANELGEAVKRHLRAAGVSCQQLLSGGKRLGTYYVESGVANRAPQVIYDRAGSSFAEIETAEWEEGLFTGVDIFHLSGITPALSEKWPALTLELVQQARKAGCKISFDVNYRSKLWSQAEAAKFLKKVLPLVDYCSAGKLDAIYLLEIAQKEFDDPQAESSYYYQAMQQKYPNIKGFYSTNRTILSASSNKLQGTLWLNQQYVESSEYTIDPIMDRIGGGDAFAGGILHGLLIGKTAQETIDFATAAAVLKHSVIGDCNQFSRPEVEAFIANQTGKISR